MRELLLSGPYRRDRAKSSDAILARIPLILTHVIENDSLKIKELEHVGNEKAGHFFRACANWNAPGRYLGGNPAFRGAGKAPVFGKHPGHALGSLRAGKNLAFHGVERARRREKVEAAIARIAGDDFGGAAGNLDDIGVGQESFLLLASKEYRILIMIDN